MNALSSLFHLFLPPPTPTFPQSSAQDGKKKGLVLTLEACSLLQQSVSELKKLQTALASFAEASSSTSSSAAAGTNGVSGTSATTRKVPGGPQLQGGPHQRRGSSSFSAFEVDSLSSSLAAVSSALSNRSKNEQMELQLQALLQSDRKLLAQQASIFSLPTAAALNLIEKRVLVGQQMNNNATTAAVGEGSEMRKSTTRPSFSHGDTDSKRSSVASSSELPREGRAGSGEW